MKILYYIFSTILFQLLLFSAAYFAQKKKIIITIIIVSLLWTPFILGLVLLRVNSIMDKEMLALLTVNGILSIISAIVFGIRRMVSKNNSLE